MSRTGKSLSDIGSNCGWRCCYLYQVGWGDVRTEMFHWWQGPESRFEQSFTWSKADLFPIFSLRNRGLGRQLKKLSNIYSTPCLLKRRASLIILQGRLVISVPWNNNNVRVQDKRGHLCEWLIQVPSFTMMSHPYYFQLVLGPSYQSPELFPPQQLSGERIAPEKKQIFGGADECCIHSIQVKNGQWLHSQ